MKMIDFTPLVTMGYKKVLTRLAIASFAVAPVSYTHLTLPTT